MIAIQTMLYRILLIIVLTTTLIPLALAQDPEPWRPDRVAAELLDATGGRRVKVIWSGYSFDGKVQGLFAFDTGSGKSHTLVEGRRIGRPRLTTDGTGVVFNVLSEEDINTGSFYVPFDGGEVRPLLEGKYSWILSTWRDPKTGDEWVLAGDNYATSWKQSEGRTDKVYRHRLKDLLAGASDRPDPVLVWDASPVSLWFTLSADGKYAGGALPFNRFGVANPQAQAYQLFGFGCDGGLAPDNSYRLMHLTGSHRSVRVYDIAQRKVSTVPVNTMSTVRGRESVWHTVWSNNPRFFTVKAPERGLSDIWLGRFDEKFTKVDRWVRITGQGQTDNLSHAWIEPREGDERQLTPPTEPIVTQVHRAEPEAKKASVASDPKPERKPAAEQAPAAVHEWPPGDPSVVLAWLNNSTPGIAVDAQRRSAPAVDWKWHGLVRLGAHEQLRPAGGRFDTEGGMVQLTERVARDQAFTVSVTLRADSAEGSGDILTIADSKREPLLKISQQRDALVVALAGKEQVRHAAWAGDRRWREIAVVVDVLGATLFLDGEQAAAGGEITQLDNWRPVTLSVGDWSGDVQRLIVRAGVVTPGELRESARNAVAFIKTLKDPSRTRVRATRLAASPTPDAKEILPYVRSLAVHEYRVDQVIEGTLKQDRIYVAHFTLMGGERLPLADAAVGEQVELLLEPFDAHPALQAERRAESVVEDFDQPLLFDVTVPKRS